MFASTKLIHIDYEAINNMIYPLLAFENNQLTFDEFKKVLSEEVHEGCSEEDVRLALNMEAACTYMLDTLNEPVNVEYAVKINEILTQGRVTGNVVRDHEIEVEDLEYIKILRNCGYDLSAYDLSTLVPGIPNPDDMNQYMNITEKEYSDMIHGYGNLTDEKYGYNCFVPMIRQQYFKKSNIVTGAIIVCKIVLQARSRLMFIRPEHKFDLALALLETIYYKEDKNFKRFVDIMSKHRVDMNQKSSVKVMIHYET